MDIVGIIIGLLAGALVGLLIGRRLFGKPDTAALEALRREREEDRARMDAREAELRDAVKEAQASTLHYSAAHSAAQQEVLALKEKLQDQVNEIESLQARMTKEFKLIANDLLEQKGRQITDQQHEKLDTLLKPLHSRIKEFEEWGRKAYESEGRERGYLQKEIAKLVEQNHRLTNEADNLTRALKGESQTQGAWGEMLLEKLLESSGLVKGQEYSMQESTTLGDGTRLRPDAVVSLPEEKVLIIDSKVSLLHYDAFVSSNDPGEKERLLKAHIESLRTHAKGLNAKDYTQLYGVQSVDFVLMFVPIEPAFLLALRERPEIFQEAYDRNVVMVTHTTLMATLRTVYSIWKNERIARNHVEIAERAGKMYEKFSGFVDDLIKVGKQLDIAQDAYRASMNKLSKGPGNLVRQTEMLKELGAKTNKSLPDALLKRALDMENDPQQ